MVIDVGLRHPLTEHDVGDVLRLDGVLHERVAVVVVPDKMVIELGRALTLILGSDPPIVPVCNDDIAVRIHARDQNRHSLVENLLHLIVGARRVEIHDLRCRLTRGDLCGVQRIRLHEHDLPIFDGVVDLCLRMPARIRENGFNPFGLH